MRLKKTIFNAFSNSGILLVRSVLLFVVRIIFVKTLGKSLLGVDSLFSNLLIVLSIFDLGITTAINYSLYKPLVNKDYKKVSALMAFYKKLYFTLGISVLLIGLCVLPFINLIVTENVKHIHFIYLLYLGTTTSSYFISYKDCLLYADQRNYEVTSIVGLSYILIYVLRIIFLLVLPNFIVYVLIQFIGLIIQRILINRYITKKYYMVDFNSNENLSKEETKEIKKSTKSMFLYKVGGYLVTGSDSLVISANPNLGVSTVGIYVNYISITSMLDSIIYRGLSGMTASFGDLSVSSKKEVQENVYNIASMFNFIIYGVFTIGFWFLLTPFIKMFFGSDFELSKSVLFIICVNFYLIGILKPLDIIKDATGLFNNDKYATLIQTAINLVTSILLSIKFGLIGVVLGTLISTILVPLWNKPYIVYKYVFKKNFLKYFKDQFKYALILIFTFIIINFLLKYISISNLLFLFIIKGIIIVFIFMSIIIILFRNNDEFKYIKDMITNMLGKIRKIK